MTSLPHIALLLCLPLLAVALAQAQEPKNSDPIVQNYIKESDAVSRAYAKALAEKRTLIESRQLLSLQPFIAYLDSEIAHFSGDQTKPRLILSDSTNPNVATLKSASATMFSSLLAEQTALDQQHRQILTRFEDEAKKLKWNEARLALGRIAIEKRTQKQEAGSDLSALVRTVKEIKVPTSILTRKTDKIYHLTVVEGSASLTPQSALAISHAKFPTNKIHLFGPADTGRNLKDCFRAISGKGIETRCYLNAGWNMLTNTLKLPTADAADFTYQEVDKPAKSDIEYITIVAGAPDPKDPKSILVYTINNELKPFWVKTYTSAQDVYGILVVVEDEAPK